MNYVCSAVASYYLNHEDWFFDNIGEEVDVVFQVVSFVVHAVSRGSEGEKNSKIHAFLAGWYVYDKSEIEYIIYVNKTAIRTRCLIYWRGSRAGLFAAGRWEERVLEESEQGEKRKKKYSKNG